MSKMQKTLVERCGQDALRHIRSVVCQIPNCSAQATEEYMQQLLQPLKQFDPFYKVLQTALGHFLRDHTLRSSR